jgi:hypothetical protein
MSIAALAAILVYSLPLAAEAQIVLTNAAHQAGNISNSTNTYTLTANTGDNLVLRLGTTNFDGNLQLYGPTSTLLATAASGTDAELDYTATNSGTFTVLVSSYLSGGAGSYVLCLAQFPEPFVEPPGQAGGPISNGGDYPGTNSLGDLSMWSFPANTGDNIVLRLGTTNFDGNLRLYGPNGALLKTAVSGTDAELDWTATNSGTFTALVSSYLSQGAGTYVLYLAQFPEAFIVPPGQAGGPISNGGDYPGTNSMGALSLWSFPANNGDNIVLRLGTTNFDGNLRLYGPNGALLKTAASGTDAELDWTATNSGTFTALVSSYLSEGAGTYVLYLAQFPEAFIVPPGRPGGAIINGGIYPGTNSQAALSLWSFPANTGDNIVLRLGTASYDGNLRLYGPNGALLKTAASGTDAELDWTATNSGTFTALVSSYVSQGAGTFVLYLAQFPDPFIVPPGGQGGPISNGGEYPGINSLAALSLWSFTANTGANIVLRLATTNFDGNLRLYGPNGDLLGTAASGMDAELTDTATNSGTFTALVSSYTSGGTGTFVLYLAEFPGSFIVPPGSQGGPMDGASVYYGTLTLGDLEIWAFTACTGESIDLQLNPTNFSGNLNLYGPNGDLLRTAASASAAVITYTATNCGTFEALVSSYASGGTGTYGLTANSLIDEMRFCAPVFSNKDFTVNGIGGPTNAAFVLYAATNIVTPIALWTPVLTNQFDQFGVFAYTNINTPVQQRQQFFRFQVP